MDEGEVMDYESGESCRAGWAGMGGGSRFFTIEILPIQLTTSLIDIPALSRSSHLAQINHSSLSLSKLLSIT